MIPILDIETAPDPDVLDNPVIQRKFTALKAPANYKDPEKIAIYLREAQDEFIAKLATDKDTLRIVAIGVKAGPQTSIWDAGGFEEAEMLRQFWTLAKEWHTKAFVHVCGGFCLRTFDLPALIRRSQILGVPHNAGFFKMDRYKGNVLDIADVLTDFRYGEFPKPLEFYAYRFGVLSADADYSHGSDVPRWVDEGNWSAITDHLSQDLEVTAALAEKLGVV